MSMNKGSDTKIAVDMQAVRTLIACQVRESLARTQSFMSSAHVKSIEQAAAELSFSEEKESALEEPLEPSGTGYVFFHGFTLFGGAF